jgi:hypothetical protein
MTFTDHNVYISGKEGWYGPMLVIMGIEVNDTRLTPECNHYLCLGIERDLNEYAPEPQALIDAVNEIGGVGFIAHPFEHPAPKFGEGAIPWHNWLVSGYAGLEIWNYMSEFKSLLTGRFMAVRAAFEPDNFITAPFPETLAKWDELLRTGQKIVAIGNSDAHAQTYKMGPLSRILFPYRDLFSAIRTHILLKEPLSRNPGEAKAQVLGALRAGHCFVAYDHIGDTTGFRFNAIDAEGKILFTTTTTEEQVIQGDEINFGSLKMIELAITTPDRAEIRLLRNGKVIAQVRGATLSHIATEPGVYRVECHRVFKTRWRGWIYSNPIYIRA